MNNVKYLNIQFIIFYYQKTKYTLESRRMNQNRADLLEIQVKQKGSSNELQ